MSYLPLKSTHVFQDIEGDDILETEIDLQNKTPVQLSPSTTVADVPHKDKDSVKSFDSGTGSDVGNDAIVADDMSSGTFKQWATHL